MKEYPFHECVGAMGKFEIASAYISDSVFEIEFNLFITPVPHTDRM